MVTKALAIFAVHIRLSIGRIRIADASGAINHKASSARKYRRGPKSRHEKSGDAPILLEDLDPLRTGEWNHGSRFLEKVPSLAPVGTVIGKFIAAYEVGAGQPVDADLGTEIMGLAALTPPSDGALVEIEIVQVDERRIRP